MRIPRPFPDSNAGRFPRSAAFLSALAACSVLAVGCSGGEELSDVSVQLSTSSVDATPFPSDRFTVSDTTQYTARRIALPLPDCSVRVSDCADLSLINTLDGFNTQPRISIPFTGDIDPATDIVIHARAALGFTGAQVTNGAITGTPPRNTWPLIRAYLNAHCGTNYAP